MAILKKIAVLLFVTLAICPKSNAKELSKCTNDREILENIIYALPSSYQTIKEYYYDVFDACIYACNDPSLCEYYIQLANILKINRDGIISLSMSDFETKNRAILVYGYLYSIGSSIDATFASNEEYLYEVFDLLLNNADFKEKNEQSLMILTCAGTVYFTRNSYQKAINYQNQALKLALELKGDTSKEYISCLGQLFATYSQISDAKKIGLLITKFINSDYANKTAKIEFIEQILGNIGETSDKISDDVLLCLLRIYVDEGGTFTHNIYNFSFYMACCNRVEILNYIESNLVLAKCPEYESNPNGLTHSLSDYIFHGKGDDVFGFYAYVGRALDLKGNNSTKAIEYYIKAEKYAEDGNRMDMLYDLDLDTSERIPILVYLADAYSKIGQYDNTIKTYQRLLAGIKSILGMMSPEYICYVLQYTYYIVDYTSNYDEAMHILSDIMPQITPDDIRTNKYIGDLYITYARYCYANGYINIALEYAQKAEKIPTIETHLKNIITTFLISLYIRTGDIDAAYKLFITYEPSSDNASDIINMAMSLYDMGNYTDAINVLKKLERFSSDSMNEEELYYLYEALAMYIGFENITEANKYHTLASNFVNSTNQLQQIQHKLNRCYLTTNAYEIYITLKNVENDYIQSAIDDNSIKIQLYKGYGYYYSLTLDNDQAISFYNKALKECLSDGRNSEYITSILSSLLNLYRNNNDFHKAYETSSDLWGIYQNKDHWYIADGPKFICSHIEDCINCGYLQEAKDLIRKYQKFFPNETSRLLRAKYAIKNKEYDLAESVLVQLVQSHNKDIVDQAYATLEQLYIISKSPKIGDVIERNELQEKKDIIEKLLFMSPLERKLVSNKCFNQFGKYIQCITISNNCVNTALDYSLFSKGLLFHTNNEIIKALGGNKSAQDRLSNLRNMRDYLNTAIAHGDSAIIRIYKNRIDEEERNLTNEFVSISKLQRKLNISSEDVLKAIGKRGLAIDFVRYNSNDTIQYGAFVFSENIKQPHFVQICNESTLLSQIQKSDGSINAIFYRDKGNKGTSYNLIWGKLVEYFDGYDDIYFSGDGLLNQMPIELLPNENDVQINDLYKIHRVFHLADIRKSLTIGNDFIAIGVSDYNTPIIDETDTDRGGWSDLNAVITELNSVKDQFKPYLTKYHTKYVLNNDARETYVKSLNNEPITTLHISTHGFYKDKKTLEKADALLQDIDHYIAHRALIAGKESLSGLILRNGNLAWKSASVQDSDDDILTSDEIENMTFPKLNLTVLSACETGLGDVDSEGVWGLQRAFRIAGTQSLICSLCKIDDTWTAQFMNVFYQNAASGKSIYDSFIEAKKYLYCETKNKKTGYNHLPIWASIILIE